MTLIYLFNLILVSRLLFYFKDNSDSVSKVIRKSVLQLFGLLLLQVNWGVFFLALTIIAVNILCYVLFRLKKSPSFARITELAFLSLTIVLFSYPGAGIRFNYSFLHFLAETYPLTLIPDLFKNADWKTINIFLSGFLFLMLESSLIVKSVLEKFHIGMEKEVSGKEENEKFEGAGKLIGILERLFIFILILLGEYSAIGLIIAAKSFARFKELDKRAFAEYVLIGTLISTLIAFIIALIIKTGI